MRTLRQRRKYYQQHRDKIRAQAKARVAGLKKAGRCYCGAPTDDQYILCAGCRQKSRARLYQLRRQKTCVECKRRPVCRGKVKCRQCLIKATTQAKRYRAEGRVAMWEKPIRDAVFAAYGGRRCACCGETEGAFLTIDHIEGGGRQHIRQIGGGGIKLYRWLRNHKFPKGYRVLCMNCNWGRYRNGGECPHVKNRQATISCKK